MVTDQQLAVGLGTLFSAIGMWLLLPGTQRRGRMFGVLFGLAGLGFFASLATPGSQWAEATLFWILAAVTIVASAATVTMRSPVYCAIWFALSLLGTAGLFMFQGAQFLGVATIVVYAGAILVTFLFVLMLANPSGHAFYDRLSWEGMLSAATGAVLVGLLTMTISSLQLKTGVVSAVPSSPPPSTTEREPGELATEQHMAHLGRNLFSTHLIAVEIAGTLLLVALVGAVAIVAHEKGQARLGDGQPRPAEPQALGGAGGPA